LYRGPRADDDWTIVGPDDDAGPDAGSSPDSDLTDQDRFRMDVGLGMYPRAVVSECIKSHGGYSNIAPGRRRSGRHTFDRCSTCWSSIHSGSKNQMYALLSVYSFSW
jgi:hypothetical protein